MKYIKKFERLDGLSLLEVRELKLTIEDEIKDILVEISSDLGYLCNVSSIVIPRKDDSKIQVNISINNKSLDSNEYNIMDTKCDEFISSMDHLMEYIDQSYGYDFRIFYQPWYSERGERSESYPNSCEFLKALKKQKVTAIRIVISKIL